MLKYTIMGYVWSNDLYCRRSWASDKDEANNFIYSWNKLSIRKWEVIDKDRAKNEFVMDEWIDGIRFDY